MKRFTAILALTFISLSVFSQGNKLQSAINYLRYNELDKAMEAIDLASKHEKTGVMTKTWYYRGKIYLAIYQSKEDKFKKLHTDPLKVASESLLKAKSMDVKKIDGNDLTQNLVRAAYLTEGDGIELYRGKKYAESLVTFERLIQLNQSLGRPDSLAAYNVGLSAYQAGEYEKALTSFAYL